MAIKCDDWYNKNGLYATRLCQKYRLNNFSNYIDLKNYNYLSKNKYEKFYQNKKNPCLILKIINIENNIDIIIKLMYSKDGNVDKLEYYKGIPNVFYCNDNINNIWKIEWHIKDKVKYNNGDPSKVLYFSNGEVSCFEWTNENGILSNIEFPAYLYRAHPENLFLYSYIVNNINISYKNLENIIKNIKNGKVKKHINKYSDANKLKIFKEIAKYYNLIETLDTIENRLLVLKLENKI